MSVHADTLHLDFKQNFALHLRDPEEEKECMFFSTTDAIYSLGIISSFLEIRDGDEIYQLGPISWQEEGNCYHNVCGTGWDNYVDEEKKEKKIAVYNYTQDILLEDAYLGDKYNDCSDDWFSNRLKTIFVNYPKMID